MGRLLRDREFIRPVAVQCLATAAFFVYIGGSSIVLQDRLGITATQYAVLFATNAAGMAVASLAFRLLVSRVGARRMLAFGVTMSTAAALALAVYTQPVTAAKLAPTWALLAVIVAGMGLSIPATTSIAQHVGRASGGTASALLGGLTFAVGAAATPITGFAGLTSVAGMATLMAAVFLAATVILLGGGIARRTEERAESPLASRR
jgi:DHA1 family bicyclomycin/chloramphenicol resistance-like MFS transporter